MKVLLRHLLSILLLSLGTAIGFAELKNDGPPIQVTQAGSSLEMCRSSLRMVSGLKPTFLPELEVSDKPLSQIIKELNGPGTVFITDAYNASLFGDHSNVIVTSDSNPETLLKVATDPRVVGANRVVGLGGGVALDVAKAAGVERALFVVPTIISTNCISNNRTVVGSGLGSMSYQSGTPAKVVYSMTDLLSQDPAVLLHWTSSGLGDFFSEICAAIDTELKTDLRAPLSRIRSHDPMVFSALTWVNNEFDGYNRKTLHKITAYIHSTGVNDIGAGSNMHRIGGEHEFYKAVIDVKRKLNKAEHPTHGHLTALGTLVTAYLYGKQTGNNELYTTLRSAFGKIGIPITWKEIESQHLSREEMIEAMKLVSAVSKKPSVLKQYFKDNDFRVLDEIFGI